MGHERTKSLVDAAEFLRELRYAVDTPAVVRDQLVGILRHLPNPNAIEQEAERQLIERGKAAWLLPINFYEQSQSSMNNQIHRNAGPAVSQ